MQDLLAEFVKNINDFIELCQGKTVVFDFDGTMTRFEYGQDKMLPWKRAAVAPKTKAGGNMYQNVQVLRIMQYIIGQLKPQNVWVLTATSVLEMRPQKNAVIMQKFQIPENRIIHTDNDEQKIEVLRRLHAQEGKEIIFAEDTVNTLLTAEDKLDFVRGWHISMFLV